MRELHVGVFDNAQANDTGMALWRHPENQRMHFDRLDHWKELAGICEEAHLDFLFLADAWGWAEINGVRPDICTLRASSSRGSTRQSWSRRWCLRPRISAS